MSKRWEHHEKVHGLTESAGEKKLTYAILDLKITFLRLVFTILKKMHIITNLVISPYSSNMKIYVKVNVGLKS